MEGSYLFEKTFDKLAGYTVKQIENILPLRIVSINGNSIQPDYVIRKNDAALIEVKVEKRKKI